MQYTYTVSFSYTEMHVLMLAITQSNNKCHWFIITQHATYMEATFSSVALVVDYCDIAASLKVFTISNIAFAYRSQLLFQCPFCNEHIILLCSFLRIALSILSVTFGGISFSSTPSCCKDISIKLL